MIVTSSMYMQIQRIVQLQQENSQLQLEKEQLQQEKERLRVALNRSNLQTGTCFQPSYLLYVMQEEEQGRRATGETLQRPMVARSIWQYRRERAVKRNS